VRDELRAVQDKGYALIDACDAMRTRKLTKGDLAQLEGIVVELARSEAKLAAMRDKHKRTTKRETRDNDAQSGGASRA
jgi:hypothetical protein